MIESYCTCQLHILEGQILGGHVVTYVHGQVLKIYHSTIITEQLLQKGEQFSKEDDLVLSQNP